MPSRAGRIKGLRSLGSTGEFSMGFSLKQKKPLDLSLWLQKFDKRILFNFAKV